MLKIRLSDEDLFGNEAAEDERQDVFDAYAYSRSEVDRFCDDARPIQIVRAYKGEGKSALMRIARSRIDATRTNEAFSIDSNGPALSPDVESTDFAKWVRAWMTSIMTLVAGEIGARIGFAWKDDAIALVELAEQNGLRARNLVSTIVDRLKSAAVPIERTRQPPADPAKTIRRWQKNAPDVWVFIDDIDRNFDGSMRDEVRVAAFFEACRTLIRQVDSVRFRLAVRPNTWTTIKRGFEGMSHLEQYLCDLKWSDHDMLVLLAKRIEGYVRRTNQMETIVRAMPIDDQQRLRFFVGLAFETPVEWSGHQRPIHVPLDTLSMHRPRWLVELCRVSSRHAAKRDAAKIELAKDVFSQLDAFGDRRLDDTVAEFKVQCPQIAEVLDGFRAQSEQYLTADLLRLIENRILNHVPVRFPAGPQKVGHRDVAAFLFQIGFIYARKDYDDGSYEHIGFADQPSLLTSRSDTDSGCSWEIPPVFRQALDLRTPEGFERPVLSKKRKPKRVVVK